VNFDTALVANRFKTRSDQIQSATTTPPSPRGNRRCQPTSPTPAARF